MSCHTRSIGKRPTSLGYEFILDTFSLSSRPTGATSQSVQIALEILATESNRESNRLQPTERLGDGHVIAEPGLRCAAS